MSTRREVLSRAVAPAFARAAGPPLLRMANSEDPHRPFAGNEREPKPIDGMDGRSFLPLLEGRRQPGRGYVFAVFHETSARKRCEMPAITDRRFGYILDVPSARRTPGAHRRSRGGSAPQICLTEVGET